MSINNLSKRNHAGAKEKGLIKGKVIGHPEGYGFLTSEYADDMFLDKQQMCLVLHGDVVLARRGKMGKKNQYHASIVEILEHNTQEIIGKYCFERNFGFVEAESSRICHDIYIPKGAAGDAKPNQMVVVRITEYASSHAPMYGEIIDVIGDELAPGMEIEVALRHFDIPHQWPVGVEADAQHFGHEVIDKDKQNRVDYRLDSFVTIDGEDARDFDDAIHVEKNTTTGGWRLRVAIADVSHYVKPSSVLDKEAQNRATSVYFPDYVVPMLPEALSNGLCSLNPHVDRLVLICDMQISAEGVISSYQFAEGVICSHARLTYTLVGKILGSRTGAFETANTAATQESLSDEPNPSRVGRVVDKILSKLKTVDQDTSQRVADNDDAHETAALREEHSSIVPMLDMAHELYKVMTVQREKRGALEFESSETRIIFDQNRKISEIKPIFRNDAHKLIEEFMLAANTCAATCLDRHEVDSLFRVHESPAAERLENFRDFLGELGLTLGGGDKPAPMDFKRLSEQVEGRSDASLIHMQMLRTQQQAVYQVENNGHFGLAYDLYAHFTSPIRRYPDLLVHRAIRALIQSDRSAGDLQRLKQTPSSKFNHLYPYSKSDMDGLGEQCSMAERRAEEATRDVMQWLKCEYLQQHVGDEFEGLVSAITPFGMFVTLENMYVDGLVHISSLPRDYYEHDPIRHQLIGQRSHRVFKLGDRLLIQVANVNLDERKIDFVLANSSELDDDKSKERKIDRGMRKREAGLSRRSGKASAKLKRASASKKSRSKKVKPKKVTRVKRPKH